MAWSVRAGCGELMATSPQQYDPLRAGRSYPHDGAGGAEGERLAGTVTLQPASRQRRRNRRRPARVLFGVRPLLAALVLLLAGCASGSHTTARGGQGSVSPPAAHPRTALTPMPGPSLALMSARVCAAVPDDDGRIVDSRAYPGRQSHPARRPRVRLPEPVRGPAYQRQILADSSVAAVPAALHDPGRRDPLPGNSLGDIQPVQPRPPTRRRHRMPARRANAAASARHLSRQALSSPTSWSGLRPRSRCG